MGTDLIRLGTLFEAGEKVQSALNVLLHKEDAMFKALAAKMASVLDEIVLEILGEGMRVIDLSYATDRPKDMYNPMAVLRIFYQGHGVSIPAPRLVEMNWDMGRIVGINLGKQGKGFGYIYSTRVFREEPLEPVVNDASCYCGHTLTEHQPVKVHFVDKFNTGTAAYPRPGSYSQWRIERRCGCCSSCRSFTLSGT